MNQEILKDWFFTHFVPSVLEHLSKNVQVEECAPEAMLLLDNAPSHPDESVPKASDEQIFVTYLRPHVISSAANGIECLESLNRRLQKSIASLCSGRRYGSKDFMRRGHSRTRFSIVGMIFQV